SRNAARWLRGDDQLRGGGRGHVEWGRGCRSQGAAGRRNGVTGTSQGHVDVVGRDTVDSGNGDTAAVTWQGGGHAAVEAGGDVAIRILGRDRELKSDPSGDTAGRFGGDDQL